MLLHSENHGPRKPRNVVKKDSPRKKEKKKKIMKLRPASKFVLYSKACADTEANKRD